MSKPWQVEFEFLHDLMPRAASLMQHYSERRERGDLQREDKPDGSLVTEADHALNDLIVNELHRAFPADAICAEEGSEWDDPMRSRRWIVDPIDGTRSFAKGRGGYSIMIGLAIDGQPALGAVHAPEIATTAIGAVGAEIVVNGSRRPAAISPLGLVSGSHDPEVSNRMGRALGFERVVHAESVGSRSLHTLAGDASLFTCRPRVPKLWDTLAPAALILAAGGIVRDFDGNPLRYDTSDLTHERGMIAWLGERDALDDTIERLRHWYISEGQHDYF